MPIYSYACEQCGHRFDQFVQTSTVPECPRCQGRALAKQLTSFSVGRSSGPAAAAPLPPGCGNCGDPRGPGACRM